MNKFIDMAKLDVPTDIQTDVVIVGAGAAGITLARSLARARFNVALLESGGLELESATQSLFQGEVRGIKYYDLAACRLRYFGGTTNHWAGFCRPYTHDAFAGRPDLGVPAWPINEHDLNPYITRAASDLGLDVKGFDLQEQARRLGVDPNELPDAHTRELVSQVYQLTHHVRQGKYWKDTLLAQQNLKIYLHANVTHINLSSDGLRVQSLTVRAVDKPEFKLRARVYVLATHGIESARLLLDSNDVHKNGIGNQFDHVGRYFMEHPKMTSGRLIPSKQFLSIYNGGNAHQVMRNINIGLSKEVMLREGVLDYYCRFLPVPAHQKAQDAAQQLRDSFWKPADAKALRALGKLVGDIPGTFDYLAARWNSRLDEASDSVELELDHRIEQAPNPDSRVTLSEEKDALGCRKAILNWHFNDLDYKTYAIGQRILVSELTRLGWGRFVAPPLAPEGIRSLVLGNRHHIGTVRMSAKPQDGVVNTDLRVHGVENLFVTGSAIFTNGGHAVPTMIIMAFAMRLAEHLTALKGASA